MKKILLIDGNSIMNRAFYGISAPMTTDDGKQTNALYGFLAIMFKNMEEVNPDYMLVAFDSKTAANVRKQQYAGYKASRHGMPEELAYQMPEIKDILDAMNIKHLELPDFEGDDILGTTAKKFASKDVEVFILSGDRDLFQLVQDNITIRIPKTKMGKTETEIYDVKRVEEEYGLMPSDLVDLKALMGDSSDEIPGAPGVGPKTATTLLQKFKSIDGIYEALKNEEYSKDFKPKVRESLENNKDLVDISKVLGAIKLDATITDNLDDIKVTEWNKEEVVKQFNKYKFRKYLNKFGLDGIAVTSDDESSDTFVDEKEIEPFLSVEEITDLADANLSDKTIMYIETKASDDESRIVKKDIIGIAIYNEKENKVVYLSNPSDEQLKEIAESDSEKIGFNLSENYVLLKEKNIDLKNMKFDVEVAAYDINPTNIKHTLEEIAFQYLEINLEQYKGEKQTSLFEENVSDGRKEIGAYIFVIKKFYEIALKKLEAEGALKLFDEIEMPLIRVLGDMKFNGMICIEEILQEFGNMLKEEINQLTREIYDDAGEEFNINSTQQLGVILFEKLGLPAPKKNKKGYSTDVDTLEKISYMHDIIPKILQYRTLSKLNSTYVDGLIPCINPSDNKIHSTFHQTITATGRISSTDPNLQNIPARDELGKNIKKAFVAKEGYVYIDADYSQIELRVLAHMSQDENMLNAFRNDEDIHREVASKVFNTPFNEVTKEQRSRAKAVNFGIVYGITGFGLANQIGTTNKEATNYINSYLEKYSGVNEYMKRQSDKAKETGYVETLFGRRRYIPELKSSNYMVREFGKRAAMNSPIQGTAADIMKIAMNKVYDELKKVGIDAKIVLQVHDELIIEASEKDKEKAKEILQGSMENAVKLDIPLKVEIQEAKTWYDAK